MWLWAMPSFAVAALLDGLKHLFYLKLGLLFSAFLGFVSVWVGLGFFCIPTLVCLV